MTNYLLSTFEYDWELSQNTSDILPNMMVFYTEELEHNFVVQNFQAWRWGRIEYRLQLTARFKCRISHVPILTPIF